MSEMQAFHDGTGPIRAIAFSPDHEKVVSASVDGTIHLWDTETGETLRKYEGNANKTDTIGFL